MTVSCEETTTIPVPVADGQLCSHLGHCQQFALDNVDLHRRRIESSRRCDPPLHKPGLFPQWLSEQHAQVVIAGGMSRRARDAVDNHGIQVVVGAPPGEPHGIVQAYLDGDLAIDANPCDR